MNIFESSRLIFLVVFQLSSFLNLFIYYVLKLKIILIVFVKDII